LINRVIQFSDFLRNVIMTKFKTIAIGTAGLALTLAAAAPASAQYGYPQQGGGVVGAIVNAVTGGGYGQYPMGNYGYQQVSQRSLVQQCAAAAEQRLGGQYRGQGYGAYNGNGYQQGYGQQGYGYQNQSGARVLGITSVERRGNGGVSVRGVATSGAYGQQGYGQQAYGQQAYRANGQADVSFNCKVNARGQVTDVKIARNNVRYNRGY
jgi:hypothetical protein